MEPRPLGNNWRNTSLSQATMRSEDLIPTFIDFLWTMREQCNITEQVIAIQREWAKVWIPPETAWLFDGDKGYNDSSGYIISNEEFASELLNHDIWNLLDEIAPIACSFGAHEGDGADYGFWVSSELIESLKDELREAWDTIAHDYLRQIAMVVTETTRSQLQPESVVITRNDLVKAMLTHDPLILYCKEAILIMYWQSLDPNEKTELLEETFTDKTYGY